MSDQLYLPSWHDVGLPETFVQSLHNIKGHQVLESLVLEKVFHQVRRLQYIYTCGVCGHVHKAEKANEHYAECDKCYSPAVYVSQSYLRIWNRSQPAGCSNGDKFAQDVVEQMRTNYAVYFKRSRDEFTDDDMVFFRWRHNCFVVNYLGGDRAEEPSLPRALCKAALLVPFLWDGTYDWKNYCFTTSGRQAMLVPTLHSFIPKNIER